MKKIIKLVVILALFFGVIYIPPSINTLMKKRSTPQSEAAPSEDNSLNIGCLIAFLQIPESVIAKDICKSLGREEGCNLSKSEVKNYIKEACSK